MDCVFKNHHLLSCRYASSTNIVSSRVPEDKELLIASLPAGIMGEFRLKRARGNEAELLEKQNSSSHSVSTPLRPAGMSTQDSSSHPMSFYSTNRGSAEATSWNLPQPLGTSVAHGAAAGPQSRTDPAVIILASGGGASPPLSKKGALALPQDPSLSESLVPACNNSTSSSLQPSTSLVRSASPSITQPIQRELARSYSLHTRSY